MYKTTTKQPCVYVSIQGGRKKIYEKKYVYLEDKTEFDLELINPTKDVLLAKISFNNNLISNSGIVLKPGERILLKRYIDENKAFLFEEYEHIGLESAVSDNGKIEVKFYREEKVIEKCYPGINTNIDWTYYPPTYYPNTYNPITYNPNTYRDNIYGTYYSGNFNINSSLSLDNLNTSTNIAANVTGRIGEGKETDQEFQNSNKSFENIVCYTTNLQILSVKNKPNSVKEVKNKGKVFCHKCGKKAKYDSNFCSHCGTKLIN